MIFHKDIERASENFRFSKNSLSKINILGYLCAVFICVWRNVFSMNNIKEFFYLKSKPSLSDMFFVHNKPKQNVNEDSTERFEISFGNLEKLSLVERTCYINFNYEENEKFFNVFVAV